MQFLSLERRIAASFGIALGVVALAGTLAWWQALRVGETFRLVDHSHEVLLELEQTLADLLNMQTATRGYLLTGNENYLRHYHDRLPHIEAALTILGRLMADNPAQLARLAELEPIVARASETMHGLIAARRAGESEFTTGLDTGKLAMDAARLSIAALAAEEHRLLDLRSQTAQLQAGRATLVLGLSTLCALAIVTAAGLLVRRDFYRRRAAEAERDRFFTLSRDLLCIVGFNGYFKRVNPAFTETLGWTEEELLSRPFHEFLHPDDQQRTLAEAKLQTFGHEVIAFDNRYVAKDGTVRTVRWNARPVVDAGLIYCIGRDITDQLLAEQELARLNASLHEKGERLEAANRELEAFSYSVSHDLRAPLRHIDGFASLLQKNTADALDPTARRHLDFISGAARQMGRLIDDLLSFSRMGRAALQPSTVDQDALVAAVRRDGRYDHTHPGITWIVHPLPVVHADPGMLRQVWANLIDNAVKYSSKHPAPRIEIGVEPAAADTSELACFVRDNGAGFDPRYASKLFGVFQRLHAATEFEGTGIGLANVRRILTRHGGRVWADSQPGAGATFSFTLPAPPASSIP